MSGITRTTTSDRIDVASVSFVRSLSVAQFLDFAKTLAEGVERGLSETAHVATDDMGGGWSRLRATSGGFSETTDEDGAS